MDPFFPFEEAVDVWARTFAALGIQYKGATMRLDLCDRPGKYSNGFCHWPQPAWRKVIPLAPLLQQACHALLVFFTTVVMFSVVAAPTVWCTCCLVLQLLRLAVRSLHQGDGACLCNVCCKPQCSGCGVSRQPECMHLPL